jgi:hypothetical protein
MALQKAGHFGGRILVQRLRQTQLVNHHIAPKSAAQSGEIERPTAAIDSDSEFGKSERHIRIQVSGFRIQEKSKPKNQQAFLNPEPLGSGFTGAGPRTCDSRSREVRLRFFPDS